MDWMAAFPGVYPFVKSPLERFEPTPGCLAQESFYLVILVRTSDNIITPEPAATDSVIRKLVTLI